MQTDTMVTTAIPISVSESIIEAFWDGGMFDFRRWNVAPNSACGARVEPAYIQLHFNWARRPETGVVFTMERMLNVSCETFDQLVLRLYLPRGTYVVLHATTDKGTLTSTTEGTDGDCSHSLDLDGSTCIRHIRIEILTEQDGTGAGGFYWLGLSSSARKRLYDAQWEQRRHQQWDLHIKSTDFTPSFTPQYGIFLDGATLDSLRARHAAFIRQHNKSPFVKKAEQLRDIGGEPEALIAEYAAAYDPKDGPGFCLGVQAAVCGMILQDAELLRLAVRYALSMACCDNWDGSFLYNLSGSSFDNRAFTRSFIAHDLALIMDLAGEMLTYWGKEFLLRRIAEQAEGGINYVAWKYDYMYDCNQLAAITKGRIAAYLVLEREWPRVKPYTELAMQEFNTSMARVLLPDGSSMEGPMYYQFTLQSALLPYYYYARSRNLPFEAVLPESIRRSGDYAEVFLSTDESRHFIPMCEGGGGQGFAYPVFSAFLAAMLPQSHWVTLYRRIMRNPENLPADLSIWEFDPRIPAEGPAFRPFVALPEIGCVSSVRELDGEKAKLFITGNRANADHNHDDKGSFVLEFAGEAFAVEPGSWSYVHGHSPYCFILKRCDRHNMLIPVGIDGEPAHPRNPIPVDIKPHAQGDAVSFQASVDLTPGWEAYYQSWTREWLSPSPEQLIIRDRYALKQGTGVEFYWNTMLDVELDGTRAIITGKKGRVILEAPAGAEMRLDVLPFPDDRQQNRIVFAMTGTTGIIEVRARLEKIDVA